MEEWISWPWMEMMTACVMFMGLALSVFLLIGKFPASRFLGQLTVAYLIFIPLHILRLDNYWQVLAVLFIALSINWYTSAFFTQNSRIKVSHVWAIVCLVLLTQGLSFLPYQWLSLILIWIVSLVFLINAIRKVRGEADNRGISWFQSPGQRLVWFRNFLLLELITVVTLMVLTQQNYLWLVNLIIGANFIYIYYQIFLESGFFAPLPVANKYKKSTLSASQKSAIVERLDKLVLESKFYLNDDASLSSLAEALHTSTHHLSQVLNESKGISFQELISQNRIREARQLLKDPELMQTKVENIATMVGYNSKSAFNTAFKRHTGMTPSEFRESKDVLTYREEPLPDKKKPSTAKRTFSLSHLLIKNLKRIMVSNFLKTFIRTLNRNKVFTLINLFGLTVGFACSMLIYLFVMDELSYDQTLPNHENIFRVNWLAEVPQTRTPHPMAQAMRKDFPEVKTAVSFSPWYGTGLTKQEIKVKNPTSNIVFEEPDFYFADSTFFDVFQLEIVEGNRNALREPNTLIITDKLARKYFGDQSAIGKILEVSDMPIAVTAVVKGMPRNSHFHFNALISYVTVKQINPESHWMTWQDFGHFNYLVLEEGTSVKDLENKVEDWIFKYVDWGDDAREGFANGTINFQIQPIADIHLHSHLRWELESNGNVLYVFILIGTLIFILIIASINYVNLTTAKSVERAKEIGIRKTLGAVSENLTLQFYLESVLFCFVATILAAGLTAIILEPFNELSSKSIEISELLEFSFIGKASLLCLMIGLISGFYPAFYLSSFKPTDVLKGKASAAIGNNRLRSILVISQFIVSAILIASTLIILNQIQYMKTKELGFDGEAVISIPIRASVEHGGIDLDEVRAIQHELRAVPGIQQVAAISNLPGSQFNNHPVTPKDEPTNRIGASEMFVDLGLIELFDLEIMEGRTFDKSFASDTSGTNVLVNEALIMALNLENPVGKQIAWHLDGYTLDVNIVGVTKDFHYKSLHEPINPLVIQFRPMDFNQMVLKLEGSKFQQTITTIENVYSKFDPDQAFEYHFLDEQIADLYENEVRTLGVFSSFASVALFLACLGLLGIALAMLSQKVKEVGIRKILGASPMTIVNMIFMQFARLVGISLVIGLPIAYFLMQEWLNEFPYQVKLGPMPFVWSALLLLVVAISSVSIVVTKIASTNPVKALRYE